MKDQKIFEQISKKLNVLIALGLSSNNATKLKTEDGVRILIRFGLSSQEIADILDTTRGTVDVLKSRIKKNKK